jgi:hypothetical protein
MIRGHAELIPKGVLNMDNIANNTQVPEKATATTTETGVNQEPTATKEKLKTTLMDDINYGIAKNVALLAKKSDSDFVQNSILNILNTICVMNQTGEYDKGIRINGELYRFNEYEMTSGLNNLVVAGAVKISEAPTAYDLSNHRAWEVTRGRALTPSEMKSTIKIVGSKIRLNPTFYQLARKDMVLLAEAAKYAVYSKLVTDRHNNHILFLRDRFDDEVRDNISEWIKLIALDLIS